MFEQTHFKKDYLFIYLTLPIIYINIYIYIQELHTMDKWQGTRYSLRQLQRPLNIIVADIV